MSARERQVLKRSAGRYCTEVETPRAKKARSYIADIASHYLRDRGKTNSHDLYRDDS